MDEQDLRHQLDEHIQCVSKLVTQLDLLREFSNRLADRLLNGGRLFLMGNGGSAADAQHIAAEFVGRFKRDRRPLKAMALTTDTSILTAVTNDYGPLDVFRRQVQAWVEPSDVVWALSVSGTSANVIEGLKAARELGALTLGFTGRSGGHMMGLCDLCFRADHDESDRVQECHQFAYHLVCGDVEKRLPET